MQVSYQFCNRHIWSRFASQHRANTMENETPVKDVGAAEDQNGDQEAISDQ